MKWQYGISKYILNKMESTKCLTLHKNSTILSLPSRFTHIPLFSSYSFSSLLLRSFPMKMFCLHCNPSAHHIVFRALHLSSVHPTLHSCPSWGKPLSLSASTTQSKSWNKQNYHDKWYMTMNSLF